MIRSKWMAPVFAFALMTSACGDDPVDGGPEPDVATMRLVVGTQTINVNASNGAVTGGPLVIASNTNVSVAGTFLRADGSPDPLVTGSTFALDVVVLPGSNVTFTRTGPFAGTLRGTTAGSTTIQFGLLHLAEGHNEFEFNIPVTIQ
jgi:hypothetical protein